MVDSGRDRSSKNDCSTNSSSSVDRGVGRRIRMRRLLLEIELHHLAGDLGIRASALERMETGQERPSPALLARIGSYLGVSVGWFFRGLENGSAAAPARSEQHGEPDGVWAFAQPDVGAEMFELLDHFLQVDGTDRQAILDYARQRPRKQER